jgi:hypothetical protein
LLLVGRRLLQGILQDGLPLPQPRQLDGRSVGIIGLLDGVDLGRVLLNRDLQCRLLLDHGRLHQHHLLLLHGGKLLCASLLSTARPWSHLTATARTRSHLTTAGPLRHLAATRTALATLTTLAAALAALALRFNRGAGEPERERRE